MFELNLAFIITYWMELIFEWCGRHVWLET